MPDQNDDMVQALYNGLPPNPDINEALAPNDAIAKALMEYGQRQAQGMANLAMTPGKVAQGQQSVEEAGDWGPAMAMALMGRGMPTAEAGAAGIFGGRLAETADLPMLNHAQMMESLGAPREEIHGATGWFRGPDKQWRFEIPDAQAEVSPIVSGTGAGSLMSEHLFHPQLYKNYPDLRNLPVKYGPGTYYQPGSPGGAPTPEHFGFKLPDPGKMEETGGGMAPTDVLSAIHEAQHAVQRREGFAPGANFMKMQNASKKALQGMGLDPEQYFASHLGMDFEIPYNAYFRHAGEAEARNVEYRQPWSVNARRVIYPWETADVPESMQWVTRPLK